MVGCECQEMKRETFVVIKQSCIFIAVVIDIYTCDKAASKMCDKLANHFI